MADQADGSIIIDTEINSDGFKAGSVELLAAIKALSTEVKNLGQTLKELFSKPLTPEINTGGAEDKVAALEAKVQELQTSLEELQNTNGGGMPAPETATPQVNIGGVTEKASGLQREIDAVNSSVQKLEPTFQKAMSGSKSAMTSFEGKASTLESKIAELQGRLDAFGQTQFPTQEYAELCAETEKAGQKLESLLNKQEKMQALGVSENSAQWKNLQYDLDLVAQKYDRLEAAKAKMEASGTAFQAGVDTTQYAQMESTLSAMESTLSAAAARLDETESTLSAAAARLDEMRAGTQQSESLMSRLASSARNVASFIGRAAKSAAGALVSGIKAAASGMAKMRFHSKKMNGQFGGLISGAKKFALSLLGARGVWALLRKAVSAYMAENQQLSNTLSACWSGIGNLLGPIITRIINLVAQAVAYMTTFLKLFGVFGKSATKAINSAGGAASKATDKLKRQLAAFDELNILSDNSSDNSGGGGSGDAAGSLPDVDLPDWAKLMADQIKIGDWAAAAKTLTKQLNSMIAGVDWAGMGKKIGRYLNGALTFLATAILTFDWYALGADLATSLNHIIYSVDWANLGVVLGAKFIILIQGLGGLFATLDWTALGMALSAAFMGLWNAIDWVQAAKTLSDGVIGVLSALSTVIKNIDWQKLGHDTAAFIANIDWTGVADALFEGIGAALGGLAAFLQGLIEEPWNSVVDWWHNKAHEDGKSTITGLLEGIDDGLDGISTWINQHILRPIVDGFCSAFGIEPPSTVMAEQGEFLMQGMLKGLVRSGDPIKVFFNSMMQSVINIIVSQGWSSVGSNICSGIAEGISSGWNWLKQKVSDLAGGLVNAAKSVLRIQSPSRVFRDEVGLNIGYGIGEGVEASQPSILRSVSGVADAIADEFNAGNYQVGSIVPASEVDGALSSFSDKITLDQQINDRGIMLDRTLVTQAIRCDERFKRTHMEQARSVTGLDNPNSPVQLKAWLAEKGVEADSLSKAAVAEMLEKYRGPRQVDRLAGERRSSEMTELSALDGSEGYAACDDAGEVELALSLRQELAKSSVKKYTAMQTVVGSDDRARGLIQFYGANRTGRYAGRLIQVQNLPQNHLPDLDTARALVRSGNTDAVEMLYDSVPLVLSELIRTAFVPKSGCRFYVADFSAIEARVIAWIAGEHWRQEVFANGGDIYCASASQMFHVPVEKHGVNGHLRQKGKIAELALGYGGSVGALKAMGALNYGLQEEELKPLVDAWRQSNPHITKLWWDVDKAASTCVRERTVTETHGIRFYYQSGIMFVILPSGRRLVYVKPKMGLNRFGNESVTYEGVGEQKKWLRLESYGPKFVENIVQATARDILAEAMLRLNAAGYRIVMHVHDEAVIEAPPDTSLENICSVMGQTPTWASGLLLRADGYVCDYYKKD